MADLVRTLGRYVCAVAAEWRIGPEFCVVDAEEPAWAYIALDWRLPRYPGRDLALLWDERTGWAMAIETSSGEDLILVAGLGDEDVISSPSRIRQSADDLVERGGWVERPDSPFHRAAGRHDELADEMIGVMRR
jgi:hypothetical protein